VRAEHAGSRQTRQSSKPAEAFGTPFSYQTTSHPPKTFPHTPKKRLFRGSYKAIRVEQDQLGRTVLDRIFRAWLDEAILVSDYLPLWLRMVRFHDFRHQWFWDGMEHVDPAKEANAQAQRLKNHTTTLAYEYARQGRDWEAELRQRAKEVALIRRLGLSAVEVPPPDRQDEQTEEKEAVDAPD